MKQENLIKKLSGEWLLLFNDEIVDHSANVEDMLKIAKALGTPVEYLITGEEPDKIATDDPAKTEIYQFIKNLDRNTTQQILGVLKLFNYMTLNPQFVEKKTGNL